MNIKESHNISILNTLSNKKKNIYKSTPYVLCVVYMLNMQCKRFQIERNLMGYKSHKCFSSKYFVQRELQAVKYLFIAYVWSKVGVFFVTQCTFSEYSMNSFYSEILATFMCSMLTEIC